MVMAIILPHQNASCGDTRPHTLWLYWQQSFAAKAQKLQIKSAYHGVKAPQILIWFCEMQNIRKHKPFFPNNSWLV
jgi:hypothetical protein